MTREIIDQIFSTGLGEQLDTLYSTSDSQVFIRFEEAKKHTEGQLNPRFSNPLMDKRIVQWFRDDEYILIFPSK